MPNAVPFTPRGFVPGIHEPRGRLGDYARQHGRDQADAIRRGGEISANLWSGIGQSVAGSLRDIAAYPEQQRQAQMMATKQAREEQAYQEGQAAKQAEAEEIKLYTTLRQKHGGLIPNDVVLKNFSLSAAKEIIEAQQAGMPKVPGNREIKTRNLDGSESIQIVPDTPGQSFESAPAVTPPKTYQVTVPGPNGQPITKTVTEAEMAQGVPTYRAPTAPPAQDNVLVPIVGPDGKTRYGTREEARGQLVPAGASRPATGIEKRALNFFNRADQADKDLESMENDIQKMNLGEQKWMQLAPNFAQTDIGQRYTQAQRAFTEARLRKDSGAAIPDQEFKNDRETYFTQPGDKPDTLEQKRRARAAILASLGFESGQALGEFVGDPDEAKRMIDVYRTRAKKIDTQSDTSAVPDLAGLRPGAGRRFTEGPFSGQTWSVDAQGRPYKVGG